MLKDLKEAFGISDRKIADYRAIFHREDINTLQSFYYVQSTVLEKILADGGMPAAPKSWLLEKQ